MNHFCLTIFARLIYHLNGNLKSNPIDDGENRKPNDAVSSIKDSNEISSHI